MEKIRIYRKKIVEIIKYRMWMLRCWIREHKKAFAGVVAGTLVLILGLCWIFLRTYHQYEVIDSVDRKSDTSANYYFREDGIVCYSKDGISFTNNKGEDIWNQVFGMDSPKMSTCDDYIAVGDVGANSVFIFSNQGLEGKMNLEKPLQDLRVSKQGVVAVVLSDDSANQINLYSKKGDILASIKATIGTTGYPLTLALSEDGTRLVVSYIVFEGGKVGSQMVFYNFSNKETSSVPAGSFNYDELFSKVMFTDKNTVVACGENGFYTYGFKDTAFERNYQPYAAEVKSIFVTDKTLGIVTKNTETAKEGEIPDKYLVETYYFSGRKKNSFTFDFDYKYVSASDQEVIFYNEQSCEMYTYWGHKKFQYTFEHDIQDVLPGEKSGEYILLDAQSVQTIRLK